MGLRARKRCEEMRVVGGEDRDEPRSPEMGRRRSGLVFVLRGTGKKERARSWLF
jgi:hypothetical protein